MLNARDTRLLERLVERVSSNTSDESAGMIAEDADDFLSPERHARERERLFLRTPQVIGFAGEVREPGSYLSTEVMGTPVLVTRDEHGSLHAFVNACAHRGARVAEGCGRRSTLTCRFHGWSYALDGSLRGQPQADCFDVHKPDCALARLPVSDRAGLLVVGLSPGMQPAVDAHLAGMEEELAGLKLEHAETLDTRRYELATNWKLAAAVSYESYHFATLHRDTVATMFSASAVHDFFGRHSRWCFAPKSIADLAALDRAAWPSRLPAVLSHQIFPGTVVIVTWEMGQILRSEPGPTPGSCVVHAHSAALAAEDRDQLRANVELGMRAFETEDMPAATQTCAGLRARGGRFYVGRNEPVLRFWCEHWRRAADAP
jgi:phenylpropionate dioxygenase-like ring-hydroxylating dioxygenase large terminal subunit